MQNDLLFLAEALPPWYERNARRLPWRENKDPYRVWLSEIMLQQTRVEAVRGYYARFLQAFPTVKDLAAADDERLMKCWEGLGYYSRARNLKKAAGVIVNELGGVFPQSEAGLNALPGIGPYTAGAVASICFDAPAPAVDGNVLRVYARLTEYGAPVNTEQAKRHVREALLPVYTAGPPGVLTQAIMELGATVCVPNGAPKCEACPLRPHCLACKNGTTDFYPLRAEKKARRQCIKAALVLKCGDFYALRKRPPAGLLAGLWEFPNTDIPDENNAVTAAAAFAETLGVQPKDVLFTTRYIHVFTHVEWHVTGVCFTCAEMPPTLTWAAADRLKSDYALPSAFRPLLEKTEELN